MTHQQIEALKATVKRITKRHGIRISNDRRYAILGQAGTVVKEPAAHAILNALKEDGLRLVCEAQARKHADNGNFEYVGVMW